ncbi:MFS transporter [Thermopolyspora sp. NPDC052614]|uniref:MFS transporter n=1 Tax=Thermopolyspora sp. NPDC052614 TaxID=3155682 RepID=UPI0034170085
MTTTAPDRARLQRARLAVHGLFLLSGIAIGAWTARIPAIKERLALGDGELSFGLLGIAAGAIAGMQLVGRLIDRHGSHRVMIPAALAQGTVLVLPALAPNLPLLTAALFCFGFVHGALDVSMNANAVEVEREYGRPILSAFHAVFSIGGFAGAALGGLFAQVGVTPVVTFIAVGAVLTVMAALSARWALPATPATSAAPAAASAAASGTGSDIRSGAGSTATGRRLRRVPIPGVLFLGVLAFCCLVGEGAAADWGSVYLREDLGGSPGLAAAPYAAFSVMMTAGRLVGDRLAGRFGSVPLVRGCGLLAGAGLLVALLIGHPLAAIAGFGCFGAGLSCIVPQVFSAAANRDPRRSGEGLARVASLGYVGFLSGPVLIGGAAELLGLPRALAIPAVLALFVALAATALRTPGPPST